MWIPAVCLVSSQPRVYLFWQLWPSPGNLHHYRADLREPRNERSQSTRLSRFSLVLEDGGKGNSDHTQGEAVASLSSFSSTGVTWPEICLSGVCPTLLSTVWETAGRKVGVFSFNTWGDCGTEGQDSHVCWEEPKSPVKDSGWKALIQLSRASFWPSAELKQANITLLAGRVIASLQMPTAVPNRNGCVWRTAHPFPNKIKLFFVGQFC